LNCILEERQKMAVVMTHTPRTDETLVARLQRFGVSTVHAVQGRHGLLPSALRPIYRPAQIAGNALTCEVAPGDNWTIHVAVEHAKAGDVLLVVPTVSDEHGYVGDLLATALMARGVRGLVIDAGVRDVAALTEMGFPVWSRAICAQGTVKATLGSVQLPLRCGSTLIHPGDVIVADDDGVCVVPRLRAAEVVALAEARERDEAQKRQRYAAGELSLDIGGMRPRLERSGLRYVRYGSEE